MKKMHHKFNFTRDIYSNNSSKKSKYPKVDQAILNFQKKITNMLFKKSKSTSLKNEEEKMLKKSEKTASHRKTH